MTERQIGKETERQVDREADGGLTDRNREIQTETRKKKRQTDKQTETGKQTDIRKIGRKRHCDELQ